MTRYATQVAANIRAEMARQAKTTHDLEQHLGIKRSAARARLNGQIDFRLEEIYEVAHMLGLEPIDLMTGHPRQAMAA